MSHRIYLIGYRGTGKSTVGKVLAHRLDWEFVDADAVLEGDAGMSIREIFARHGESYFRDLEAKTLEKLSRLENQIIATGGGVILRESNRELLKASGRIIWLTAKIETILERIALDQSTSERRPNLTVGGRKEVESLLAIRNPLYESLADLQISTEDQSPEEIADRILAEGSLAK